MTRLAFFGNVANVHFRLASALRDHTGLAPDLFVSASDAEAWRPESDDAALVNGYPDWIHQGDWVTPRALCEPRRAEITRRLGEYDLVVASGVGPVFAQYAGPPWCFFVTGGDLTVKPFPLTFWRWYPTLTSRLGHIVAGVHQRRASRRADRIVLQPFAPMTDAADRLGIPEGSRSERYLPLVVDTAVFRPDPPCGSTIRELVAGLVGDADFVVFHPSRLVLDDSPAMRRSGQWKGSEATLTGFAQFVTGQPGSTAVLILIDSADSRDRDAARRLIAELGIASHVRWARPPNGDRFVTTEMAALYDRADVVLGEFGVGWFGYVVLEAAATGTPVVSHVDARAMAELYPWHPILDSLSPADIAERLEELARSSELRTELGERGREWIDQFHSPEVTAQRYAAEFTALVDELVPA